MSFFFILAIVVAVVVVVYFIQTAPITVSPIVKWLLTLVCCLILLGLLFENLPALTVNGHLFKR